MDETVGGDDARLLESPRGPPEIRHPAPCLEDDQAPGRHVPGREEQFPERLQPAAGDVAEVQDRRAQPPDRLGAHGQERVLGQVGPVRGPDVVGKPCDEEAPIEGAHGRDSYRLVVEGGAPSALPDPALVVARIVGHAQHDLPHMLERDGDRVDRHPVRIVRGAVERIDVPAVLDPPSGPSGDRPALLREDGMVGKGCVEAFHDEALGTAVHLGHDVDRALVLDATDAAPLVEEQAPRGPRGVEGHRPEVAHSYERTTAPAAPRRLGSPWGTWATRSRPRPV